MSFPTTAQLDNFTRANSTTTLGANWSTDGVANSFGILTNQAYVPSLSAGYALDSWNTSFGNNQEVWCTFGTAPTGTFYLGVRMSTQTTAMNGYAILTNAPTANHISLETINAESEGTQLLAVPQKISNGDSIGISCVVNLISAWYKPSGGSWKSLGTVKDTTYLTGNFIEIIALDTSPTLTSFGGGNSTATSVLMRKGLTPNGTRVGTRQVHWGKTN